MKKILALLMLLSLMFTLSVPTRAAQKQYDYSTDANSGQRDQLCTTLEGTSAESYYTGSYTFGTLSLLSGDELLADLRTLMTSTHTYQSTYNDCRDLAVKTDCIGGDGTTVSLIYTGYNATWGDWINNRNGGWNREHLWPQSMLGSMKKSGAGTDMHHIRPADSGLNNDRGNLPFGQVDDGRTLTGAAYTGTMAGGTSGGGYFEPLDSVKGDIARICLYVYVRYGGEEPMCSQITNVFQSVELLLEWCAQDPVDTWEMGRNEVVAAIQGNRNVFIDYPELAWLLFDRAVPQNLTTPSSESQQQPPVTEPPATEPPVTEPPVTEPPVTEPPATEPEATQPPTAAPTVPAETQPPATEPAPEPDYLWLVYAVIGLGTVVSVTVIVVQQKKKS